ncbi:MAG: nicotinamide-nucleotide amidohydrolase family protein [Lachnospiraceae bacterium]|nr:nicotinamide-nucleotide amidohydrolase family protein [Lachnospiraceae bacterium]
MEEQTDNRVEEGYRAVLKLCGVTRAEAEKKAASLCGGDNPELKVEGEDGDVLLKLSSEPTGELSAKKVMKPVLKELKGAFGEKIYSMDEGESLESVVVQLLKANALSIATAESCTGGLFTARLVNVPGVSEVLKEGFITYSNKAKRKYLGVKKGTLLKYSAVSEAAAKEMAKGVCAETKSDCGVAITGLAGPEGEGFRNPVGTVFIGCCVSGNTVVKEYHFDAPRQEVRRRATTEALSLLRHCLLKYFSEVNFGEETDK